MEYERMTVTIPKPLAEQARRYADALCAGDQSGFVADAIRSHIDRLRRASHTQKIRESYAASCRDSRQIAEEWVRLDEETWARLDKPVAEP